MFAWGRRSTICSEKGFAFMWRPMPSRRRGQIDHEIALRRMDSAGATLTTTEAGFSVVRPAGSPEFKQISQLVGAAAKWRPPT